MVGSTRHSGILTTESSRFHACQPLCDEVLSSRTVYLLPVVNWSMEELGVPVRWVEPKGAATDKELAPNQIVSLLT